MVIRAVLMNLKPKKWMYFLPSITSWNAYPSKKIGKIAVVITRGYTEFAQS